MDVAFRELINESAVVYLDDLTIYSKKHLDHMHHLRQVMERCRKYGIFLDPKISIFAVKKHGDEQLPQSNTDVYGAENNQSGGNEKALKEEKHHKNMEHLGEAGAVGTGGFALHKKREEKKDPENARRHKTEEEIAAAAAVGEGGYGFHEHHDVKESKKEAEEAGGKKHHHLF